MSLKKHDRAGIAAIVMLISGLIYSFLSGDAELFGRLLETNIGETVAPDISETKDGEFITLTIGNDGDILKHSEVMQLQGAIEFTGLKGDRIVLQKQDGVWIEVGRYLIEEE